MSKKYVCREIAHQIPKIDFNTNFGELPSFQEEIHSENASLDFQPERRLWLTVLFLGIRGVIHGDSEDIEWFNSTHGLEWVCNLLNIDPVPIRKKVLKHAKFIDKAILPTFPVAWAQHSHGYTRHKK